MKLKYKIWIDNNGKVFGRGPYELLKKVQSLGTLNKASKEMEMSYSKAWKIINNAEKELGFELIEKRVGGVNGGGSFLTEKGEAFLKRYEKFYEEAENCLESLFKKHFDVAQE